MSFKIRLTLAYDGSEFAGWQRQKKNSATVQEQIETALSKLFDGPIRIIGSSRTDTGVHARMQLAHFVTDKDPQRYKWPRALNALLPRSICVYEAALVPSDFHAIASVVAKTYRYFIWNHPFGNPFKRNYYYHVERELYVNQLNLLSRELLGHHDFRSFQTSGSSPKTTDRIIYKALWQRRSAQTVEFRIRGSGFLKQMVRNIVGTCLDLHFKKHQPQEMRRILTAQDRSAAWGTAPAHGLYLWHIEQAKSLDKKCLKI